MDRTAAHVPDQAVDTLTDAPPEADVPGPGQSASAEEDLVLVGVGATHAEATSEPPASAPVATAPGPPSWGFGIPEAAGPPAPADQPELPLPPVISMPPPSRSGPLFGPVGRRRSAALTTLLSAATLGVFGLVWYRRVNREMEEFDPKLHARPGQSTVAVALPWLIGLLVSLAGAAIIVADRLSVHLPFDTHVTVTQAYYLLGGVAAIPYLMLIIPVSAIAVVMTLERLRSVEEHVGLTADRQVRAVGSSLLLLVPIIGGLVLVASQQRRLNAVWESVAPHGHTSH
jgi:hypothetical protein